LCCFFLRRDPKLYRDRDCFEQEKRGKEAKEKQAGKANYVARDRDYAVEKSQVIFKLKPVASHPLQKNFKFEQKEEASSSAALESKEDTENPLSTAAVKTKPKAEEFDDPLRMFSAGFHNCVDVLGCC